MASTEPASTPAAQIPAASTAVVVVVLGCLSMTLTAQSILTVADTATTFLSQTVWHDLVTQLGGSVETEFDGSQYCRVPFVPLAAIVLAVTVVAAIVVRFSLGARRRTELPTHCVAAWKWWLLPGVWELLRIFLFVGGESLAGAGVLLTAVVHYVLALSVGGWLVELGLSVARRNVTPQPVCERGEWSVSRWVIAAVAVYIAVFTTMNWQLYQGLLVPHGDSAMYEEHLWNVTHGKGFRSYLDQGLFLGEHVQVVHLLLLPLYVVWPSHLLLELCESLALGSGAIAVFWITRRATDSQRCGVLLAVAYLLYPALQFLDIAADLKTFRPISFGVPALLFAFDQMERRRVKTTLLLFALALSAKEDYALILGPLGVWLAAAPLLRRFSRTPVVGALDCNRRALVHGFGLAAFAVAYLLLSTRVVIPWFRDGAELHYVSYFSKFGSSFGEVVTNMLTNPGLLISELMTFSSCGYLLALLFPLAFLPLLSPTRLAVGVPILVLLCLNDLIKMEPQPWHHFHAPVVPVLFWAAAHGAGRISRGVWPGWLPRKGRWTFHRADSAPETDSTAGYASALAFSLSLCFGVVVGMTPLGLRFWDAGSFYYWRSLYVPGTRAEFFPQVLEQIPPDARVASTDFVHSRFTHHERSYDYSNYRREVAGYEDRVPEDTDFIVIDTRHHYSEIQSPDAVRELRTEPEKWELLADRTDGHFIVLKRRVD